MLGLASVIFVAFALFSPKTGAFFIQTNAAPLASSSQLSGEQLAAVKAKADTGDATAQVELGEAYEDGKGVRQDERFAAVLYRKAADQGNATAQNHLGPMYLAGGGVERNKADAVKWFRQAAKQKHPKAMFNLGAAYFNGDGVAIDDSAALAWFSLAQEAGSDVANDAVQRFATSKAYVMEDAWVKIGDMYLEGSELSKNPSEAIKWYRKAAGLGSPEVQVKLAGLLTERQGDARPGEALDLCTKAAKQNYAPGAFCVGLILQRGLGVSPNPSEAAKWFQAAADRGHASAMLFLGEMYWKGSGVKIDKGLAYRYIYIASTANLLIAQQDEAQLEKEMSPKEVEKARKKAVAWAREHQPVTLRKRAVAVK